MTVNDWMSVAAGTETNRPREAMYCLSVMLNRCPSIEEIWKIIVKKWQFSAFNDMPDEFRISEARASAWVRANLSQHIGAFPGLASRVQNMHLLDHLPLPRSVKNYWSPRSMVPKYSRPKWDFGILRVFEIPEIDPYRFRWAETVHSGHPLSGWRKLLPEEPES